jgi:hypothetical protein
VTGGLRQTRAITAGESYNSMNSLRGHFGLGAATVVDSIVVRWPSGIVQRLTAMWGDQVLAIRERDATTDVGGGPRLVSALRARPNPSAAHTSLSFTVAARSTVRIGIHDTQGRAVRVLHDGVLEAGPHGTLWDGRDDAGRSVPPGVYVARLQAAGAASGLDSRSQIRLIRL